MVLPQILSVKSLRPRVVFFKKNRRNFFETAHHLFLTDIFPGEIQGFEHNCPTKLFRVFDSGKLPGLWMKNDSRTKCLIAS
jgi:hypothetical protein